MELLGLVDRSLIMRLMDDYIMISTYEQAVTHFLQKIHQAFKPFGGGVNPLKTKVSYPHTLLIYLYVQIYQLLLLISIRSNYYP